MIIKKIFVEKKKISFYKNSKNLKKLIVIVLFLNLLLDNIDNLFFQNIWYDKYKNVNSNKWIVMELLTLLPLLLLI